MNWKGKVVRIVKEDIANRTASKIGTVLSQDAVFIEIETERGIEVIPLLKVIRIELINKQNLSEASQLKKKNFQYDSINTLRNGMEMEVEKNGKSTISKI